MPFSLVQLEGLTVASGSSKVFWLGGLSLTALYSAWKILSFLSRPLFSPFRYLPGPKNPSWLFGNVGQFLKAEPGEPYGKWIEEHGPTLTYKSLFNQSRFITLDPKALSHVLNHSYDWPKPPEFSEGLGELFGEGLLFAEGDAHKRQRRIMNPSFSLSHLRELTPVFLDKSAQLRDIWLARSTENGGSYNTDVLAWLNKVTLDIIGLAGFDYEFNALNPSGDDNELSGAFKTIFKDDQHLTIWMLLQVLIKPLRYLPTKQRRNVAQAKKVMDRIGRKLIEDKRRAILATVDVHDENDIATARVGKNSVTTRDLLSRLMLANMATDLPENQRLSDNDVFAQIPTFLIAGHETTSSATTWCLYALARDPEVQTKLREELLSIKNSTPSMDELNALPYLDAVIRETFRLHPAVVATARIAAKDDVLPLGTPVKTKSGAVIHEVRVSKGETILIPILSMNTSKGIWGDDANEFRPERWYHKPEKASEIPGVWGNVMSFLGGPRSCIGYRFALIEMKCLIWTLVRGFTFEFTDPAHRDGGIIKIDNVTTRPVVKAEAEKGSQLPLKVTPWRGS